MRLREQPIFALLALGLLWALAATRRDLFPSLPPPPPPMARQAIVGLAAGVWAGAIALAPSPLLTRFHRRRPNDPNPAPARTLATLATLAAITALAAMLFVLPLLALHVASAELSAYTLTALFTLVPFFTVVLSPHLAAITPGAKVFPAALAAVPAAFLLLPTQMPTTLGESLSFLLMLATTLLIACGNCLAWRLAQRLSTRQLVTGLGFSCAILLAPLSLLLEHPNPSALLASLPTTLFFDLPPMLLLLWLIPRMAPHRLATRLLVNPLVAVLLGAVLIAVQFGTLLARPQIPLAAGFPLLAACAFVIAQTTDTSSDEPTPLPHP